MLDLDFLLEDCDLLELIEIEEGFFIKKKLNDNDREKVNSAMNSINDNNYNDDGEIKIGSTSLYCNVSFLLNTADWAFMQNVNSIKQRNLSYINSSGSFDELEGLAISNITSDSSLIKFVNKYKKIDASSYFDKDDESKAYNTLKNKKIHKLVQTPHDTDIFYCYDDNCCYIYQYDTDKIYKVSNSQVLQASKTCYDDLKRIIKICE